MEEKTFLFVSGILEAELPAHKDVVILSGPSHAEEASAGLPTLVVSACPDLKKATAVQEIFHQGNFRVYTNTDRLGVEIGGSVKNIIAIAAGICFELGYGSNGLAALMTRGMAEIARLGKKLGGKSETFYGLAGMGDLITTCFSEHSRNRAVGVRLARGESLAQIETSMNMVAEGTYAVRGIRGYAKKENIDMPITEAVYRILFEGLSPKQATQELFSRQARGE
jgi:glycerol-3-phosphate dehydrogenase (NAD(P)+)